MHDADFVGTLFLIFPMYFMYFMFPFASSGVLGLGPEIPGDSSGLFLNLVLLV